MYTSTETSVLHQNDSYYHLQETGGSSNETSKQNENDRREDLPSGLNRYNFSTLILVSHPFAILL